MGLPTIDTTSPPLMDRIIPPSSNWYCPKLSDVYRHAQEEYFAYGAKNSIIVLKFNERRNQFSFHLEIDRKKHVTDRVQALTFLQPQEERPPSQLTLVCAGAKGSVEIWTLDLLLPLTPVAQLKAQHAYHEHQSIQALASLHLEFIFSADLEGTLCCWNLPNEQVMRYKVLDKEKDAIVSLAVSELDDLILLALGYRSGKLVLWNARAGMIHTRLRGHDGEVQNVSFSGSVLASSSRDARIRIWNFITNENIHTFDLPKAKNFLSHAQRERLWLPLTWLKSGTSSSSFRLLSGAYMGQLYLWEWTDTTPEGQVTPKLVSGAHGHARPVFNLTTTTNVDQLITLGMDREIKLWHITSQSQWKVIFSLPTLGGIVTCVDVSNDSGIVAVGMGDQTIRLWSQKYKLTGNIFHSCETLWKGIHAKVSAIQWCPNAAFFATGQDDGSVSVIESRTKDTFVCSGVKHASAVIALAWKQSQTKPLSCENDYTDSCCASMAQALEQKQKQPPALAKTRSVKGKSTQALAHMTLLSLDSQGHVWKSSFFPALQAQKCVFPERTSGSKIQAILMLPNGMLITAHHNASVRGHVFLESNELECQFSAQKHTKSIRCLAGMSNDEDILTTFASGSMDHSIVVYELETCNIESSMIQLKGHTGPVLSLSWSKNDNHDRLASSSMDGSIRIWNTQTYVCIRTIDRHQHKLAHMCWDVERPGYIVSGGEDQTLQCWPSVRNESQEDQGKPMKRGGTELPPVIQIPKCMNLIQSSSSSQKKVHKKVLLNSNSSVGGCAPSSSSFFRPYPFLHKPESVEDTIAHCSRLANNISLSNDDQMSLIDRWNSSKLSAMDVEAQLYQALEKSKYESPDDDKEVRASPAIEAQAQALFWAASYSDFFNLVEAHPDVLVANERWITLAWIHASAPVAERLSCLYARACEVAKRHTCAAFYYLALGKVHQSIECLMKQKLFHEALVLAKIRLHPQDDMHREITHTYATECMRKNHIELAAKMYLSNGDVGLAIETLYRSSHVQSLRLSLELALEHQDKVTCSILPFTIGLKWMKVALEQHEMESCQLAINLLRQISGEDDPNLDYCLYFQMLVLHDAFQRDVTSVFPRGKGHPPVYHPDPPTKDQKAHHGWPSLDCGEEGSMAQVFNLDEASPQDDSSLVKIFTILLEEKSKSHVEFIARQVQSSGTDFWTQVWHMRDEWNLGCASTCAALETKFHSKAFEHDFCSNKGNLPPEFEWKRHWICSILSLCRGSLIETLESWDELLAKSWTSTCGWSWILLMVPQGPVFEHRSTNPRAKNTNVEVQTLLCQLSLWWLKITRHWWFTNVRSSRVEHFDRVVQPYIATLDLENFPTHFRDTFQSLDKEEQM